MSLSPAQHQLVVGIIEYMRQTEPPFVEGELVATKPGIVGDVGYTKPIPGGVPGVVVIEWQDELQGVPCNCFVVGVRIQGINTLFVAAPMEDYFISIDPVWGRPPRRPFSLGVGNA